LSPYDGVPSLNMHIGEPMAVQADPLGGDVAHAKVLDRLDVIDLFLAGPELKPGGGDPAAPRRPPVPPIVDPRRPSPLLTSPVVGPDGKPIIRPGRPGEPWNKALAAAENDIAGLVTGAGNVAAVDPAPLGQPKHVDPQPIFFMGPRFRGLSHVVDNGNWYKTFDTTAPSQVVIRNGKVKRSSHNTIHGGGGPSKIVVENLECSEFEVAGIQFNGAKDVIIRNVSVGPSAKTKVMGSFTSVRFIGFWYAFYW
jgi:hypothetical protein